VYQVGNNKKNYTTMHGQPNRKYQWLKVYIYKHCVPNFYVISNGRSLLSPFATQLNIKSMMWISNFSTIQIKENLLGLLCILNPQYVCPDDSYDLFEYYFYRRLLI